MSDLTSEERAPSQALHQQCDSVDRHTFISNSSFSKRTIPIAMPKLSNKNSLSIIRLFQNVWGECRNVLFALDMPMLW